MTGASLGSWVWLTFFRGGFWRVNQWLPRPDDPGPPRGGTGGDETRPSVAVVIPARNEAEVLPDTLPAVLEQDYPGRVYVILVDDDSADGTLEVARKLAADQIPLAPSAGSGRPTGMTPHRDGIPARHAKSFQVVAGRPLPEGWKGKVWAMSQGVEAADEVASEYVLFTDADIAHDPDILRSLVVTAQERDLDLVSVMALLSARRGWERFLIPAFVYFFAKLYPFRWASDPRHRAAAAAGGCMLARTEALRRAGGLEAIRNAVIDDCALARRIKDHGREDGGRIWLGFSRGVRSVRGYTGLSDAWNMVARSAFAQLRYSPLLLTGTVLGMALLYAMPPAATVGGFFALGLSGASMPGLLLADVGLAAWLLMAATYSRTIRLYRRAPLESLLLPVAGVVYTAMTISSAWRHWRGRGGAWKGRTYD